MHTAVQQCIARQSSRWSERVRQLESRRRFGAGTRRGGPSFATAATVGIVALAASALVNRQLARSAERRNPPRGRFLTVRGVRLHYVERGKGTASRPAARQRQHDPGLCGERAGRPGGGEVPGHRLRPAGLSATASGRGARSGRPRRRPTSSTRRWAELDATAGDRSWGIRGARRSRRRSAMRHPDGVAALVLASGYYYPTARLDLVPLAAAGGPDCRRPPSLHAGAAARPAALARC